VACVRFRPVLPPVDAGVCRAERCECSCSAQGRFQRPKLYAMIPRCRRRAYTGLCVSV
jgi:hypothetical protein